MIDQPPFVQALEQLVAAEKARHSKGLLTPSQIYAALLAGKCAMGITWPGRLPEAEGTPTTTASLRLSVAALPGSQDVFNFRETRWEKRADGEPLHVPLLSVAGRLGSIAKETRRSRLALNLLLMLSGPESSSRVLPASDATTIFRESQIANLQAWTGSEGDANTATSYGQVMQQVQKSPQWLFSPRIPGRTEYLAALDKAVQATIAGEKTAAEALKDAAKQWADITEKRGVESQRKAYRHCLGLER